MFGMLSGDKRKRREEEHQHRHRAARGIMERFHKLVFFLGLMIAYRGLKSWMGSKKRKMVH